VSTAGIQPRVQPNQNVRLQTTVYARLVVKKAFQYAAEPGDTTAGEDAWNATQIHPEKEKTAEWTVSIVIKYDADYSGKTRQRRYRC
jgi:hypothetical protein